MESVSVVPVGLSKFRDGLEPLKPFDKESAEAALEIIERHQREIFQEHGTHFIHASDEFYILAGRELPDEERYDGYPQLENGVGMLRLLDREVTDALTELSEEDLFIEHETISIATGLLAYPYLKKQVEKITRQFPQKKVHVYAVRNEFFGEMITVAGLLTGQDLIRQLQGKELGQRLLLPCCMFRSGEEVFLDDITRRQAENTLQVPVNIVKSGGQDLVYGILGLEETEEGMEGSGFYEGYELRE